ncbi:MAG: hypothetical protein FJ096_16390 [Deltaproteobacteria bacterium]|nr:hypothetical protein [Deltaproteobacteria bacterium]
MISASRRLTLSGAALALACAALSPSVADAQGPSTGAAPAEPSAADKETARALVKVGKDKLAGGDAVGALEAFRQAHAIMRVPTTGILVGDTYEALGKLLEANDVYKQVTLIPAQPGEAAAFEKARARARERIAAIVDRIPSLVVVAEAHDGTALEELRITVDGVELTGLAATLPRKVNQGDHTVSASAKGHRAEPVTVAVVERETKTLRLVLQPLPEPPKPEVVSPEPAKPEPAKPEVVSPEPAKPEPAKLEVVSPEPAKPAPLPPAAPSAAYKPFVVWGAYGVGAAGLVVGAITGGMSLSAASRAFERCPVKLACGEDARPDHDRAVALAHASNVGFALAGVGAIAGTVALFALPGPLFPSVDASTRGTASVRVTPFVSPTSVGLAGTF